MNQGFEINGRIIIYDTQEEFQLNLARVISGVSPNRIFIEFKRKIDQMLADIKQKAGKEK